MAALCQRAYMSLAMLSNAGVEVDSSREASEAKKLPRELIDAQVLNECYVRSTVWGLIVR